MRHVSEGRVERWGNGMGRREVGHWIGEEGGGHWSGEEGGGHWNGEEGGGTLEWGGGRRGTGVGRVEIEL